MKKRIIIGVVGLSIAAIIILVIFNSRYPFVNPAVGNWSVGYNYTQQIFPRVELSEDQIITYEEVNQSVGIPIDYIADPFFIKEKDTFYLFVEVKGRSNANIALLTSPDGKDYTYKGIVLDEDFHLSYPQVFKYKGKIYMLPETKGSGNVLLYEAKNFPFEWKIIDTLLQNIALKDPTILLDPELNLLVGADDNLEQFMYTADSLTGKWSEVKNYNKRWGNETRPGGRFFKIKDDWFLPLQNRSRGYGTGISIYKLNRQNQKISLELENKLYLKPQTKIEWFNRGMHHLDFQKIDNTFYMVYDGDRNQDGKTHFQYKGTVKLNLLDIYQFFTEN